MSEICKVCHNEHLDHSDEISEKSINAINDFLEDYQNIICKGTEDEVDTYLNKLHRDKPRRKELLDYTELLFNKYTISACNMAKLALMIKGIGHPKGVEVIREEIAKDRFRETLTPNFSFVDTFKNIFKK